MVRTWSIVILGEKKGICTVCTIYTYGILYTNKFINMWYLHENNRGGISMTSQEYLMERDTYVFIVLSVMLRRQHFQIQVETGWWKSKEKTLTNIWRDQGRRTYFLDIIKDRAVVSNWKQHWILCICQDDSEC